MIRIPRANGPWHSKAQLTISMIEYIYAVISRMFTIQCITRPKPWRSQLLFDYQQGVGRALFKDIVYSSHPDYKSDTPQPRHHSSVKLFFEREKIRYPLGKTCLLGVVSLFPPPHPLCQVVKKIPHHPG